MDKPRKSPRLSRKSKRLIAVAVGIALGLVCHILPPQYQKPCSLLSKIVGLFAGA